MTEETEKKETKAASSKVMAVVVILSLLILVSAVQAVELAGLKTKINSEMDNLATLSVASQGTTTSNASQLEKNLAELPSMVGGC